jgi:hypothetical protein
VLALSCAAVLGLDAGSKADDAPVSGDVDAAAGGDHSSPPPTLDGASAPLSCGADEHLCGAQCAKKTDPDFGCGAPACTPCNLPHATAGCAAGACAPTTCTKGWADCNMQPADGCEADLSSTNTCGNCTTKCTTPPYCDGTTCVANCPPAKPDLCGGTCTDTSTDPSHCGAACIACNPAHAVPACAAGNCDYVTCAPGYDNCNASRADGCETSLTSNTSCGTCTNNCTVANPSLHTVGACGPGPACVPVACEVGWFDCNGSLGDGCSCQGAGCCGGGGDAGNEGGACLAPGAACNSADNKCCGNCVPAVLIPMAPEALTNGTCCATNGQGCGTSGDCCVGTCSGTCH